MVSNTPNYNKADILRCLLLISGKISRREIKEKLELGEGSVRSILDILKKEGLINSSRRGHYLTDKGEVLSKKIRKNISLPVELRTREIFPEYRKVAVVVKKHKRIKSFVALRDLAVRKGAEGAMILICDKNNKLTLPGVGYKERFGFTKQFKVKPHNLLIITAGRSLRICEIAAIAMICKINKFFNLDGGKCK